MAGDIYISFGAETGELEAAMAKTKAEVAALGRALTATAREMQKSGQDMDSSLGTHLKEVGAKLAEAKTRIADLRQSMGSLSGSGAAQEVEKVAGGLNAMQKLEGIHVLRSVFDDIASGQSPMRAVAMEGGRIMQILAGLPPQFAIVAAAVAATGAALGYFAWSAHSAGAAVRGIELDAAVNGFRLAEAEASKLRDSIEKLAGVSASDAAAIAKPFLELGPAGAVIAQLVSVHLPMLAEQTGKTVPEAAAQLAQKFTDLDGEGKKWISSSRLLTGEQKASATALIDGGHKVAAYEVLVNLLSATLKDLEEKHKSAKAAAIDQAAALQDAALAGGDMRALGAGALGMEGLSSRGVSHKEITGWLGWSLGCLERPEACMALDLIRGFDWSRVPKGEVSAPKDWT